MMRSGLVLGSLGLSLAVLLSGCSNSGEDELRQWVAEQRNQTKPRVVPIPEPKQFTPQAYGQGAAIEPFSLQKLAQAFKTESSQVTANAALVAPEMARRKEALEAYPLDAMRMVGSLQRGGQPVALIRLDNLIYQVRLGNYLGQNFGKVTKIGETEIVLREIVQDATGDWVERAASLQLQERSK